MILQVSLDFPWIHPRPGATHGQLLPQGSGHALYTRSRRQELFGKDDLSKRKKHVDLQEFQGLKMTSVKSWSPRISRTQSANETILKSDGFWIVKTPQSSWINWTIPSHRCFLRFQFLGLNVGYLFHPGHGMIAISWSSFANIWLEAPYLFLAKRKHQTTKLGPFDVTPPPKKTVIFLEAIRKRFVFFLCWRGPVEPRSRPCWHSNPGWLIRIFIMAYYNP